MWYVDSCSGSLVKASGMKPRAIRFTVAIQLKAEFMPKNLTQRLSIPTQRLAFLTGGFFLAALALALFWPPSFLWSCLCT